MKICTVTFGKYASYDSYANYFDSLIRAQEYVQPET
jgi:hypothetical protein